MTRKIICFTYISAYLEFKTICSNFQVIISIPSPISRSLICSFQSASSFTTWILWLCPAEYSLFSLHWFCLCDLPFPCRLRRYAFIQLHRLRTPKVSPACWYLLSYATLRGGRGRVERAALSWHHAGAMWGRHLCQMQQHNQLCDGVAQILQLHSGRKMLKMAI